ncbi:MAG: amylo-alpha-1,6-glucosidase [Streptomyces sp.]|uniref:amylo-alpha-1,6-glucosidase n=1 Tax=Streptomyces sp. TaxID=1931 RepID=UPI003D6C19AD
MNDGDRLLVHDGTLALLGSGGDIDGRVDATPDGLFVNDGRHLSRWQLSLDDAAPDLLVPASGDGACTAVLTPPFGRDQPPACTVYREQALTHRTLVERLRLTSNVGHETTVRVALTADADFADQYELRGDHTFAKPGGERSAEQRADGVELSYRRGDWLARTTVTAEPAPDAVAGTTDGAHRLSWTLTLPPHGTAELTLRARAHPGRATVSGAAAQAESDAVVASAGGAAEAAAPPAIHELTDRPELRRACEQGLADLDLLRVPATGPDGEALRVPAAGVPWFLTLFGRDSIFTSLFALPYRPDLAAATLAALAATQATTEDPRRVAQPGKILHEVRHGELSEFDQVPYARYYGTVDATPLFLVLLGAWTEQTGDTGLARRLERHARAAVEWMFRYGGLDERGYLVYSADKDGLANQNWKDSPDAICSADGTQAEGALAVSEVQGYAYDALRHTARLARTVWDDAACADRLEEAADALRLRFRRDFWMADQDFPALALDGTGRQADALASDAGHLLWSGILDDRDAAAVGRRLLEPDFFSGWGVRTLAAGQPAYHPLTYHRGSVWPHDNAVIALGLARYGLREEVRTLADGVLALAAHTGWRLPEVLAGHSSLEHPAPVPYPHSCTPQAWAAATPLALLTAMGGAGT